jgi:hypothetical protein
MRPETLALIGLAVGASFFLFTIAAVVERKWR